MSNPDDLRQAIDDLKPGVGDVAYAAAKGLVQIVPVAGAVGAEFLELVIVPPLSKRRDKLLTLLGEGLISLQEDLPDLIIPSLSENDAFVSTVTHALQVGLRTHQKEKLAALRNAVLNSATANAPDEDIQLMFINFIDTLTPSHLQLLQYFVNPREYGEKRGLQHPHWYSGGASTVLEYTLPELAGRRDFYDQVVIDLHARGLLDTNSLHAKSTASGMFGSHTTNVGRQFLAFITSPIGTEKETDPAAC